MHSGQTTHSCLFARRGLGPACRTYGAWAGEHELACAEGEGLKQGTPRLQLANVEVADPRGRQVENPEPRRAFRQRRDKPCIRSARATLVTRTPADLVHDSACRTVL
jgi:hypothetical protein